MKRKHTFIVTIEFDDPDRDYTEAAVKEYIHDAVTSWSGQFHPDDALFGLEDTQVTVKRHVSNDR